ncbi:hypothetical protein LTR09_008177 [Extremus antarcticus]|uniref:Uncharacterized protein n=1 Tax=Extremus antarcticus TaxID=702011 RepID=A0AAJ0DB38_9PEZI|nr:hypothetical protein LTR09_008177 [Extremus antarcticus]
MASLEGQSLLPSSTVLDEKLHFTSFDEDDAPEQYRPRNRRGMLLKTCHVTYSLLLTLVLAIVGIQSIVRSRKEKDDMSKAQGGTTQPFQDIPLKPVQWRPDPDYADAEVFRGTMNGSITGIGWDSLQLSMFRFLSSATSTNEGLLLMR